MPPSDEGDPDELTPEERRRRRRRLAEVFGDVLPSQTADDVDQPGERDEGRSNDEWLRRQVPPHHG